MRRSTVPIVAGLAVLLVPSAFALNEHQPTTIPMNPVDVVYRPVVPHNDYYFQPRAYPQGPPRYMQSPYFDWRHPGARQMGIARSYFGRRWAPAEEFRHPGDSGYYFGLTPETYTPGYYGDPQTQHSYRLYRNRTPRLRGR